MSKEMENDALPESGHAEKPQEAAAPAISPGSELARRREELNLTVEQVAGQLNLAPRQIEAIEADNFDALPGMAIARGFVRSYAKLIGLEAEPLLAAMAPAIAPMPDIRSTKQPYVSKPLSGDRLSFGQGHGRKPWVVWAMLALVIVIVGVVVLRQMGVITLPEAEHREAPPVETMQSAPQTPPDGRAVEVLPAPNLPAEPASGEAEPQAAAQPVSASAAASANAGAGTSVNANINANAAESQAPAAAAEEESVLVLNAREESWIELRRSDGAILASRIFGAGTQESFPVKGELSLVVGNASGVDATLRGEPLDLQAKARANVARIKVN